MDEVGPDDLSRARLGRTADRRRRAVPCSPSAPCPADVRGIRCGRCARCRRRCLPGPGAALHQPDHSAPRSEEHTSELQSLMRISYAVFCLKKKKNTQTHHTLEPCLHTIIT